MPRNAATPFPLKEPEHEEKILKLWHATISSGPDAEGKYATVTYDTGSKNYDDAMAWRQRLNRPRYRRAYMRKTPKGHKLNYGLYCEPVKLDNGNYGLKYFATTWQSAQRYMLEVRGEDPTKWAYSSNREHPNFN